MSVQWWFSSNPHHHAVKITFFHTKGNFVLLTSSVGLKKPVKKRSIPHTHSCIHQSGLQKGFVTFSKRTDIYKRKTDAERKYTEKGRYCAMKREREKGERAQTNRKLKRGGLRSNRREPGGSNWQRWLQLEKCSTRAWWMRLRVATRLFHLNFSVSRSRRPFSASQASEQLSLVSASREGPINFPF